jgi:hypothetical protein
MTQMNMMSADNYKYSDITEKIIEAFYKDTINQLSESNSVKWVCS